MSHPIENKGSAPETSRKAESTSGGRANSWNGSNVSDAAFPSIDSYLTVSLLAVARPDPVNHAQPARIFPACVTAGITSEHDDAIFGCTEYHLPMQRDKSGSRAARRRCRKAPGAAMTIPTIQEKVVCL
jgi:hypothetical protein